MGSYRVASNLRSLVEKMRPLLRYDSSLSRWLLLKSVPVNRTRTLVTCAAASSGGLAGTHFGQAQSPMPTRSLHVLTTKTTEKTIQKVKGRENTEAEPQHAGMPLKPMRKESQHQRNGNGKERSNKEKREARQVSGSDEPSRKYDVPVNR